MKDELRSTKNLRRVFVSLLPAQAFASGLPAINLLLSSFIIGNYYGSDGIAAIGFAGPFTLLITAAGATIAMGSQLLCGRSIGKGDRDGVAKVFSTTVVLAVILGLILTLLAAFFPYQISSMLGASEPTYWMTGAYINGQAPGIMFAVLLPSLIPFLQLDQAKIISTVSVIVMLVLNIGCNLINALYWHNGFYGVGFSVAVANVVSALICVVYLLARSKLFKFSLKAINIGCASEIFKLGAPTAVTNICSVFRDRAFNAVLFGLGGTIAVSAATLAIQISNSIGGCTIQGGFAGTSNLLASVLVGERDIESLRKLPKTLFTGIFGIYVIAYVILFIFAKPITLAFGADPEYIDLFVMALRLYTLWFFTNSFKNPSLAIYSALGKTHLVSLFYAINDLLAPLFCYYVLGGLAANISPIAGMAVVFAASALNEIITVISYIIYYTIKMKKLPKSLFEITYIPREIAVSKENTLACTIQSEEEAAAVSQQVIDFCKSKGMESKTGYYCGLAIEEMAVDTIRNGKVKSIRKTPPVIDIRVFYEDGGISIMLRDNCEEFDPNEWMKLHAPEDPLRSLGIKMVSTMSKEMNHQNALGLNVLQIRMEPKAADAA